MGLLIVTGMSGAGKSKIIQALEDIGYFCVDNVPAPLICKFAELSEKTEAGISHIAVVVDSRTGKFFSQFLTSFYELKQNIENVKLLFIDASDDVLLKRFKEQRRRHPLASKYNGQISEAIKEERRILLPIKQEADFVFDSTYTRSSQLKDKIIRTFSPGFEQHMNIRILSFGYKNGLPQDADLVFDLRCFPNPFYVSDLKYKTGLEQDVQNYVMQHENSLIFYEKLLSMIEFLLPLYRTEGKSQLVIAFGCTGGKHRSVTMAERLHQHFEKLGYKVSIEHRDIDTVDFS